MVLVGRWELRELNGTGGEMGTEGVEWYWWGDRN
jgi:hypothetical protein